MRGRRSGRQPDYERRRQAAELRQQGLTFAEIARVLGTTEGAIKLRAFRAYAALREALAPLAPAGKVAP